MPYLSDLDVIIGLDKEFAIAKENEEKSIYAKFSQQIEETKMNFTEAVRRSRLAEVNWHADVGETQDALFKVEQAYIKWRELLLDVLPGADLVDWEKSKATPDEIELSIENMISLIEEHKDKINFKEEIIEELNELALPLDRELDEDRETYRAYRNATDEKNNMRELSMNLFLRIRRFIRRDKGLHSVEYGQLKDRKIREAREEVQEEIV